MSADVVFCPTKNHLKQIKNWLIAEHHKTGEGFYCNWNIIESSYKREELCCITSNNVAIGFAAWGRNEPIAHLDIVEVHPDLRRKGFGKTLVEGCFNHFRNLGLLVVDLECQPPTSEPVWRCLGFYDFPEFERFSSNYSDSVNLYRPLITHLEANTQSEAIEVVELWDKEPYPARDLEPVWTWSILRQENTQKLISPIIHPCDPNWRMRWRKENKVLQDEKVKRFSKDSKNWNRYITMTEL